MRKNNCEMIRRELDELMLGESYSTAALEHLRHCSECREFEEKQTTLRQIVGSLGTVAAPADFDFRLRARLANESSGVGFFQKSASWIFARRSVAVAAVLLLFLATGVVVVRNIIDKQDSTKLASGDVPATTPEPQPTVETLASRPEETKPQVEVKKAPDSMPRRIKSERALQASLGPKGNMVSRDSSFTPAEVLNKTPRFRNAESFLIDASSDSFKVSLDDGRGNARTISLPTIRFGSQRMLPTANQYAAVKGVW
jgi:negative regulator of sigma E activity